MTLSRQSALQERLPQAEADALLVSGQDNRRYLSGFTGSAGWLFLSPDRQALLVDGRYWAQVGDQCPHLELIRYRAEDGTMGQVLCKWLQETGWNGRLGFESGNLTVADHLRLTADLEPAQLSGLVPISGLVEELRQVKDDQELEALRNAARVGDRAFQKALEQFKAGVRESDFCLELEYQMRKHGARKPSFDSIVASGPNGAFPHAGVTDRVIQPGELVTVDSGVALDGYMSDMTRTIWLGPLPSEVADIYTLVRRAQKAALDAIRPGVTTREVDAAARDVITAAGHGEAFSHGLGHGVGLAVHEMPSVRSTTETPLQSGMVITIEPGVYLPGFTGCRVEDTVVVTASGFDYITLSPKQELEHLHPLDALR